MTRLEQLEAWARSMGFDDKLDYVRAEPLKPGYLSPHFRKAEFACNHCGELPADRFPPEELLKILEAVRAQFGGRAVVVNSGYRCPTHNRNVGGAPRSYHMLGMAADISIIGVSPIEVYNWLNPTHEGGLGRYPRFTHIDVRGKRVRW